MALENIQTVIVSKEIAKTRAQAKRAAREFTSSSPKETGSSWIFQRRPKSDFVKSSFRCCTVPGEDGTVLVYGKLKRLKNPSRQRHLQFRDGDRREVIISEWDFWMDWRTQIPKAKSSEDLKDLIAQADDRGIKTTLIRGMVDRDIADRARDLGITKMSKSASADERIVRLLRDGRISNPSNKSKSKKSKAPKRKKLVRPKTMPDPGPCSWLGSLVEWSWVMNPGDYSKKVDENGNAIWDARNEWMFMWSPKYKAIVSIRRPRNMYKLANVSRYGSAAKMFEVFAARPAENTFEITVPDIPIKKVGKCASHIVYRSDKWSPKRLESDYIHKFGKGVQLYCGPSIKNPEVFICFGGKLTLTKRGLVW